MNSFDFSAMPLFAYSRISWVICIEQNLGPHIEQKCASLAPSAGKVWSWNFSAVSGSSDRLNWSRQRNSNRARDSWTVIADVAIVGVACNGRSSCQKWVDNGGRYWMTSNYAD